MAVEVSLLVLEYCVIRFTGLILDFSESCISWSFNSRVNPLLLVSCPW